MKRIQAAKLIETLGLPYFRELSTFGALSDDAIIELLGKGEIKQLDSGEILYRHDTDVTGFYMVLKGKLAFYQHCDNHEVLTRHFSSGEQLSFDVMIALKPHSGTAIATQECVILHIASGQFFDLHVNYSNDFGVLMINLAREQAREIAILEEVIGKSTGWL